MGDLPTVIRARASLFDERQLPYAIMGGIAVRAYAIPRPTFDVDFTLTISRDRLPELFVAITDLGYTVPAQYGRGWVDEVGGMPLVKVRLSLEGRGIDADVFLAETEFQQEVIQRRQVAEALEQLLPHFADRDHRAGSSPSVSQQIQAAHGQSHRAQRTKSVRACISCVRRRGTSLKVFKKTREFHG